MKTFDKMDPETLFDDYVESESFTTSNFQKKKSVDSHVLPTTLLQR